MWRPCCCHYALHDNTRSHCDVYHKDPAVASSPRVGHFSLLITSLVPQVEHVTSSGFFAVITDKKHIWSCSWDREAVVPSAPTHQEKTRSDMHGWWQKPGWAQTMTHRWVKRGVQWTVAYLIKARPKPCFRGSVLLDDCLEWQNSWGEGGIEIKRESLNWAE